MLVVEDEPDVAQLIRLHLEDLPAQVAVAAEGMNGLEEARSERYDLIVLDVRLPLLNGLEICRYLRAAGNGVPLIIVSARASEAERVAGLELGADDYLGKPFSVAELVARARALLRRAKQADSAVAIEIGDLSIDTVRREVRLGNRDVSLTPKEFALLHMLAKEPGRVFTKTELLESIWQLPYEGYEHSVTCHVNRLRNKIERDPREPRYIVTVWGVGYKLAGG